MPDIRSVVLLALVIHDFGWITMRPEIGIPAMTVAVVLQVYITASRVAVGGLELMTQGSVLAWLIGNVVWTGGEFLWDNGHHPAGVLQESETISEFARSYKSSYPDVMLVAIIIMLLTGVALFVFYIRHVVQWWRAERAAAKKLHRLSGEKFPFLLVDSDAAQTEEYVFLPCIPMRIYNELFDLPWIVMDTSWALCNLSDVQGHGMPSSMIGMMALFGTLSVSIQTDCLRRHLRDRRFSEAIVCASELCWVLGNLVWGLDDTLSGSHFKPAWYFALGLFGLGALLALGSIFWGIDEDLHALQKYTSKHVEASYLPVAAPSKGENTLPIDAHDLEAGVLMLFGVDEAAKVANCDGLPYKPVPVVQANVDAIKKKERSRTGGGRSKRPARLTKGVTFVPEEKEPLRFAAGLALRALGAGPSSDDPIALVDLGRVDSRLEEWRARLPRVLPCFALGRAPDGKIVQLLQERGCAFECTTVAEIAQAFNFGVSAESLLFSAPAVPKNHLGYAKEKGVQLLSFDGASELRRLAAEHPHARLLLRIAAGEQLSKVGRLGSSFRSGAASADWGPLLELAAELGLSVVGVSVSGSYANLDLEEDLEAFDRALAGAADALALAKAKGFCRMEVLDLGGGFLDVLAGEAEGEELLTFADFAYAVGEMLSQRLPVQDFPELSITAEPSRFFCGQGALALLVKELQCGAAEVEDDDIERIVPAAAASCGAQKNPWQQRVAEAVVEERSPWFLKRHSPADGPWLGGAPSRVWHFSEEHRLQPSPQQQLHKGSAAEGRGLSLFQGRSPA